MNIQRLTFGSVESPDSESPWYAVEVQGSDVVVAEDKDGGRRSDGLSVAATKVPDHVDLPDAATQPVNGRVQYAVTEDGEFIAFDPDANPDLPEIRCKLGWYFADGGTHFHGGDRIDVPADTMLLLDFVER